jgi:hypothetical protein
VFFGGGIFLAITNSGDQFDNVPQCFQIPAMEIAGDPDSPTGTSGERAEVFWTEKLQALVEPTLVGDALSGASKHAGRAPDGGGQARVQTHLSVEKTGRLARFARQEGVTPNTVLQGAWLLLPQRYCGQRTVAFGAAFADRPADSPGARELPGLVPILPIIQSPRPEQLAGDWLRALRNDILATREIQHAPLGRIQRLAGRSGEALFDSIIVFETCSADETLRRRSGVMLGLNAPKSFETTIYAMTLDVHAGERLEIGYSYPRERFDAEQISACRRTCCNSSSLGAVRRIDLWRHARRRAVSHEPLSGRLS